MDNHIGARTRCSTARRPPSSSRDQADPATRWRTTLPFPVQVVARVEAIDQISAGRLTTEYRYHHGYWDGVEREFRGFAHGRPARHRNLPRPAPTDARDALFPADADQNLVPPGPVAAVEAGDWAELDLRHEYWPGDPSMLTRPAEMADFLAGCHAGLAATRCGRCAGRSCAPSYTRWTAPTARIVRTR